MLATGAEGARRFRFGQAFTHLVFAPAVTASRSKSKVTVVDDSMGPAPAEPPLQPSSFGRALTQLSNAAFTPSRDRYLASCKDVSRASAVCHTLFEVSGTCSDRRHVGCKLA